MTTYYIINEDTKFKTQAMLQHEVIKDTNTCLYFQNLFPSQRQSFQGKIRNVDYTENKIIDYTGSKHQQEFDFFIGGLPKETKAEDIKQFFSQFGEIEKFELKINKNR